MSEWPKEFRKLSGFWEFDDPWLVGPGVEEYYGPDDYMTVSQVADLRDQTTSAVKGAIKRGDLQARKPDPTSKNPKPVVIVKASDAVKPNREIIRASWTDSQRDKHSERMRKVRAEC